MCRGKKPPNKQQIILCLMFHTAFQISVQLMLITVVFLFSFSSECICVCASFKSYALSHSFPYAPSSASAVSHCVSPCYDYITLSVCCVHLDLKLITSDNLVVLFPKFKSFSSERVIESCRESRARHGPNRACWRYLPFVEYGILIAYRFLISESFGVDRTHNFGSYCSLGFVNGCLTGGIKSKLKALTIDSIWSHSPQQFHITMGRINENAAWFLFCRAFCYGEPINYPSGWLSFLTAGLFHCQKLGLILN